MTDQRTVTDVRRELVQAADTYHEQAKAYSGARKTDKPAFDAWCGYMLTANFANVIAAMLRRVVEDHGEDYAARLAGIVTGAEDDGEDAYFANDDVRMALVPDPNRMWSFPEDQVATAEVAITARTEVANANTTQENA